MIVSSDLLITMCPYQSNASKVGRVKCSRTQASRYSSEERAFHLNTADTLQIPGTSAIQCYCPADGQKLGLVNPATLDGIDRAIAKAKEAQQEWAKTTFKQRRRVLQTLLKCVKANLQQAFIT